MNKIHRLDLHLLRNTEHFQFMYEFKDDITGYTSEIAGIADLFPLFESTFQREDDAIGVEQGSIKTEAIKASNAKRDRIWRALKHRIESAVLSPFAEEVESGEVLKRIFNSYGNLPRKPVNVKSTDILTLTEELLTTKYAPHLQVVNATGLVEELKNENDYYISSVSDRNSELASRTKRQAGRIRTELDPVYNQMIETINASITLNIAPPDVDKFVKEHNNRIKTYKTSIAVRKTWSKKARQKKEQITDGVPTFVETHNHASPPTTINSIHD